MAEQTDGAPQVAGDDQPKAAEVKEEEVVPTQADFSLMNKYLRTALLESTQNVEIVRADPSSPLYSVKSFQELQLDEDLLRGIYDMGFVKPSKIQETALPILITQRKNIIAQSQSGTGKTAAFILASLSQVDVAQRYPQVLIMSPTYELAQQTLKVAQTMAKFKPTITFKFVGRGEPVEPKLQWTEHVLIGTAGRMSDSAFKLRNFDTKKIKVCVLDEADIMIDMQGHQTITLRIRRSLSPTCQILLFSATYDPELWEFASHFVPNAVEIRLKTEEQSLANIQQYYVVAQTDQDKYLAISNMFGTLSLGQTFIFCQTKKAAHFLAQRLMNDGFPVALISGDMTVEQRTKALEDFKYGRQRVMISTNLMARGIDIDAVTLVVNYDLPVLNGRVEKETYLHRIGRTGRFGRHGLAINMISSATEKSMIDELQTYFGQPIHLLDATNLEEIEKLEQGVCK